VEWLSAVLQLSWVWLDVCTLIYGLYKSIELFWTDCVKTLNRISKFVYILLILANPLKTCPFIEVSVTYGQITIFYKFVHRNTYTYQKFISEWCIPNWKLFQNFPVTGIQKITPFFEFWTIQVWIFVPKFYYADWNLKCLYIVPQQKCLKRGRRSTSFASVRINVKYRADIECHVTSKSFFFYFHQRMHYIFA
jgi:hypothetical protein